jgi:hypothetical protein
MMNAETTNKEAKAMFIQGEEFGIVSWEDFANANNECIEASELATMKEELATTGRTSFDGYEFTKSQDPETGA